MNALGKLELDKKLSSYARFLTFDGQRCARLVRTADAGDRDAAYSRLCQAQLHLSEFLKSYRVAEGNKAEWWARIACRGYPIEFDARSLDQRDILDQAGVSIERCNWAPGLTRGEVEAVCYTFQTAPPPALADIDAIMNAEFGDLRHFMALL